jgi:DNA-binding response OmpR family regulator
MTSAYQRMFKKIVLVEDDPVTLRLLEGILTRSDFLVRSAKDGQAGLEIIRREKPDLVISDVVLPRLDGLGLCAQIKEDPALASVKVVLTTAVYRNVTLKQIMRDTKADAVIEKPIDSATLLARINNLLA